MSNCNSSYNQFPGFFQNSAIQQLAPIPRWTVSTSKKVPINIKKALETNGQVITYYKNQNTDLTDLYTIINWFSNPVYLTYFLNCQRDQLVVLDIEKTCPDDIKQRLLNLPYLYGERSMSKQGYHLIFRLPPSIKNYPKIRYKQSWTHPKHYYELLLDHQITFTKDTMHIPPSNKTENFLNVFEELASVQTNPVDKQTVIETIKPQNIPNEQYILGLLKESATLSKTLLDYNDYKDRYEMGQIFKLFNNLKLILLTDPIIKQTEHQYTDSEIAWLIYQELVNRIPYRSQHDTLCNNTPYLLNSIARGISYFKDNQVNLQAKTNLYNQQHPLL